MANAGRESLDQILADAQAAPAKVQLEEYREVVETLRRKGYSWREVAEFLSQRGVATDHTRIYRHFGERKRRERRIERRPIEVTRMTLVGERPTRKHRKNAWRVLDVELPSKLGQLTVRGFAWGSATKYALGEGDATSIREANLVVKSGDRGMPMAYLRAEVQIEGGEWIEQDIYLAPKWEDLL